MCKMLLPKPNNKRYMLGSLLYEAVWLAEKTPAWERATSGIPFDPYMSALLELCDTVLHKRGQECQE